MTISHRQRVLKALAHEEPDRVPWDLWAAPEVMERLRRELNLPDDEALRRHFDVDLRSIAGPSYAGQEMRTWPGGIVEDLWGVKREVVEVEQGGFRWSYKHVVEHPLAAAETVRDVESYPGWPDPDAWDFTGVADECRTHARYAVVNRGDRLDRTAQLKPAMYLRGVEQILIDLAMNPAVAEAIFGKIYEYFMAYNRRVFEAASSVSPLPPAGGEGKGEGGTPRAAGQARSHAFEPNSRGTPTPSPSQAQGKGSGMGAMDVSTLTPSTSLRAGPALPLKGGGRSSARPSAAPEGRGEGEEVQTQGSLIDLFMMGDDFGTQNGPIVSPGMWRKFFQKRFRDYIDLAHSFGIKVMHHTCGSVRALVGDFIACGLDVLQSLQPQARDMDLAELKREFGRDICFHGSIDIQGALPRGTPEDVRREVKERMAAGRPGGGFIISTAHDILPDTPTENILALFDAYREYGVYGKV